jgi:hypothetical protein
MPAQTGQVAFRVFRSSKRVHAPRGLAEDVVTADGPLRATRDSSAGAGLLLCGT